MLRIHIYDVVNKYKVSVGAKTSEVPVATDKKDILIFNRIVLSKCCGQYEMKAFSAVHLFFDYLFIALLSFKIRFMIGWK